MKWKDGDEWRERREKMKIKKEIGRKRKVKGDRKKEEKQGDEGRKGKKGDRQANKGMEFEGGEREAWKGREVVWMEGRVDGGDEEKKRNEE